MFLCVCVNSIVWPSSSLCSFIWMFLEEIVAVGSKIIIVETITARFDYPLHTHLNPEVFCCACIWKHHDMVEFALENVSIKVICLYTCRYMYSFLTPPPPPIQILFAQFFPVAHIYIYSQYAINLFIFLILHFFTAPSLYLFRLLTLDLCTCHQYKASS